MDVTLPTGRVFTDQDFRTILEYEPEPDYDTQRYPDLRHHRWRFVWETTSEVPGGTYRLHITGLWWDGESEIEYTLDSDSFTISACDSLVASELKVEALDGDNYRISCKAWYPPAPDGYRLRHPEYSPEEPSPVEGGTATIAIEVEGGSKETCPLLWSAEEDLFVGHFQKSQTGSLHNASLESGALIDQWNNTNGNQLGPVPFP